MDDIIKEINGVPHRKMRIPCPDGKKGCAVAHWGWVPVDEPKLTDAEKAKRYDELQSWYWWLEHRTHDGKTQKGYIEIFLKGIKRHFEPYEGERVEES